MTRRRFLTSAAAAAAITARPRRSCAQPALPDAGRIITVRGPIAPSECGRMLPHEHLFSNFGAERAETPQYDEAALRKAVLPYLKTLHTLGCRTICDCTAAWFGRHPLLLRELSEKSGIQVLTNTGYYGAADHKYIPPHAWLESADQIADRWLREFRNGIGNTGIRPGFLKLGVNPGPLSEINRKLITAAARVHRRTGLVIAVHTGDNAAAAFEQLKILRDEGVAAGAWIWVHAHGVKDEQALLRAARAGAWIELDGIAPETIDRHVALVSLMKRHRLLDRVLLSHDGNSFRYGGKPPKPYDALYTMLLPALGAAGFSAGEIHALSAVNPARAFTVQLRTTL